MFGLAGNSYKFTKTIGIAVFTVCIFSSFLFNTGSDNFIKQLHGPSFHSFCLAGAAVVFFGYFFKSGIIVIKILDLYVLVFIVYMLLRTIQNSAPLVNQSQFYTYFSYGIIYSIVRVVNKHDNNGRAVILVIFAVCVVNVLVAVLQLFKVIPISNSLQMVSGLFANPGSLGGFIACAIPLTITIKASSNNLKWVKVTLIIIFGIALFLSSSRTAWIAAAVPLVIYYIPWSKIFKNRYVWIYLGVILCLITFTLYKLYYLNPLSVQGRMLIWKVSFQMFLEKPFFGYAAGGFAANYNSFQGAYFASSSGTVSEKMLASTVYTPFNEYLRILIEGGVMGLLFFTLIIVQLVRSIRVTKSESIPVYLSIFSFLIFSVFSYPFAVEGNSCLFFALIAIMPTKTVIAKSASTKLAWIIIPVYLFLSAPIFRSIYSIKKWRNTSTMWDYNEYHALQEYKQIEKNLSYNWAFMYNYGAELLRHGHTIEAINTLTKCRNLGDNVLINNQIGQAYANIAHNQQSEEYFRRSANMVPGMLSQKFALFKLYEKTRNWKKYFETAREIEQTPIKIANPESILIKNETQSSILKYKKKKNEKQI